MSDLSDLNSSQTVKIAGAQTTGVEQAFVGSYTDSESNVRLRTEASPRVISRTDLTGTFTSSSQTSSLDSEGLCDLSATMNVTAASGTNQTLDLILEESDDQSNWFIIAVFLRTSATGVMDIPSVRVSKRYYRWRYVIAGSSPSFTFSVAVSLKPYPGGHVNLKKYSDLQFLTGQVSTSFDSKDFPYVSVQCVRTDALGNGNVQIDGSNDNVNWDALTANIALNAGTSFIQPLYSTGARYYRIRANTNVGSGASAVINILWRAFR